MKEFIEDQSNLTKSEIQMMGMIGSVIPEEMTWAYEAVRRSCIYNMMIFFGGLGRYAESKYHTQEDAVKLMNECYMRFCIYSIEKLGRDPIALGYQKLTLNHIRLMQEGWGVVLKYYDPMPEGVLTIEQHGRDAPIVTTPKEVT